MGEIVTHIRPVPAHMAGTEEPAGSQAHRPLTLVWIDSREAVLASLPDGKPVIERVKSDVPAHHRSTGHVRHEPGIRHGGGGPPQTAGEPRRLEHLDRFVEQVSSRLPADHDLALIGPGTVREHLERWMRADDVHHRRLRRITCEPADQLTDRQLVARLRQLMGAPSRRVTVGAYRWTEPKGGARTAARLPRRVTEKPRRDVAANEP